MTDEAYTYRQEYSPTRYSRTACALVLSTMMLLVSFEAGAVQSKDDAFATSAQAETENDATINSNQREPVRKTDGNSGPPLVRENTGTEPGASYYGYGYEKRSHIPGNRENPPGRSTDDSGRRR